MDNNKRFSSISPIDDMFEYKSSGTFKCSYPLEEILLIGGTIACALILIGLHTFATTGDPQNSIQSLQYLLVEMAAPAVTVAVWLITMGVILAGRTYKYTADEYKFTINLRNGKEQPIVIYYHNLSSITYKESRLFGFWRKNYHTTIKTKDGYVYKFDCMENPSATAFGTKGLPFYIIEERAELFEKQKNKTE